MFGKKLEYSLFLDISSSSVTAALVAHGQGDYETIWHHRERFLVLNDTSDAMYFKKISSAILNCFLVLETNGFAKMPSKKGKGVSTIKIIVGAPWSYTLVRKNTFSREEPFVLSKKFLEKFEKDTDAKVDEDLKSGVVELNADLSLLSSETISAKINGYSLKNIEGKEAFSIEMVRLLGLYDSKIIEQVKELVEKKLPSAKIYTDTNIQILHTFIKKTLFLSDVIIYDFSGEVTETAIIENGNLLQVSYVVTGLHALVRDLADKSSLPSEHVLAALKGGRNGFLSQYPAEKKTAEQVFLKHIEILRLSLEKMFDGSPNATRIFMRCEPGYEDLFSQMLQQATDTDDTIEYSLHVFTPRLFKKDNVTDAKTNIAAFVFHNFKNQ